MLTIFSHPRPFQGEFNDIQRAAIESWKALDDDVQVVLIGNDAPKVAEEYKVDYSNVLRFNDCGTALVDSVFEAGERIAQHEMLVYTSCDIVFSASLLSAARLLAKVDRPFVVGKRYDVDLYAEGTTIEDFPLHPGSAIDYHMYRRGTLGKIPPFAIGRTAYDNWMLWAAMTQWGMLCIDATDYITAAHLNHGHPEYGDKQRMMDSAERMENIRLCRETGCNEWYNVERCHHVLTKDGTVVVFPAPRIPDAV